MSKHYCSERVFTGDRMDIGGHMCGTPATILEDDKWWCKRHTKEGKAQQRAKEEERTRQYIEDSRRLIHQQNEIQRRSRLFPELLKALEEIIGARDASHGGDLVRAVDKARPIVESAVANRDPVQ